MSSRTQKVSITSKCWNTTISTRYLLCCLANLLIEKTTPAGYNTAPDQPFTITDGDYTADNLEQTATVTNVKGLELPSTGGMGTVAFAVVGLIVMAGAAVTLIIKKRA